MPYNQSMTSTITLEQAQTLLTNWINLLTQLSTSTAQSVSYDGRTYTSKDIKQVQEQVVFWENKVNDIQNSINRRSRSVRIRPAW